MGEQWQGRTSGDAVLTRIGQAIMLHRAGDREEARNRLLALWAEVGPQGDPFHRCALAHYMADTQDDPMDELDWDLRALRAAYPADGARRPDTRPSAALRAFFPSLHLNLAADYAKLARHGEARAQLVRAREAVGELPDDAYGRCLTEAIERLELRLDGAAGQFP